MDKKTVKNSFSILVNKSTRFTLHLWIILQNHLY